MEDLQLHDFIGLTLYVTVHYDQEFQRELRGILVAIDATCNLLLDHVRERTGSRQRQMGLVSVPYASIVNIQLERGTMGRVISLKRQIQRGIA